MNGQVSLTSGVHNTQLVQTFGDLFRNKILTDVTLLCEDSFKIEAHKVILCAGSNFFREFFTTNSNDNIILYMRGIPKHHLMPLVQFLYYGETTVPNKQVQEILKVAKELEISSLDEDKVKGDEKHELKQEQIFEMPKHNSNINVTDFKTNEGTLNDIEEYSSGGVQDGVEYMEPGLVLKQTPRSHYWPFFKFVKPKHIGPSRILHCMPCLNSNDMRMRRKDITYGGGTSVLKHHMQRNHKDLLETSFEIKAKEPEMSSLDGDKIEGDDEGRHEASNVDTSNDIFDSEFVSSMSELSCDHCNFVDLNTESFEKHKKLSHQENVTLNSLLTKKNLSADGGGFEDGIKYMEPSLVLEQTPRSPYWPFFKFVITDTNCPSKTVHCMPCLDSYDVRMRGKDIAYNGGTSNLKFHMEKYHRDLIGKSLRNPSNATKIKMV